MGQKFFKQKILTTILVAIAITLPIWVSAEAFNRTLKPGDSGSDVLLIQKVLNTFPELQVASSGVGSPGKETSFFGQLTKNAIIRLQNKYKNDILDPGNLTLATGDIDFFTLKKLNDLYLVYVLLGKNTNSDNSSTASAPQGALVYSWSSIAAQRDSGNTPIITSLSKTTFDSGENITISGKNFTTDGNTILVSIDSDQKFQNIHSIDGKTLNVTLSMSANEEMKDIFRSLSSETQNSLKQSLMANAYFADQKSENGYVKAYISVKNENGESNQIPVSINMFSGI